MDGFEHLIMLIPITLTIAGVVGLARKGVPESISGAVWAKSEKLRWLWSGWLVAVALTLMVPLMSALGDVAWLGWLTVACLIGAAVTPVFRQDTRTIHNICGVAAGLLSQVCVACLCPWWLTVWLIWIPLIAGTMGAYNDAEEMPQILDGYGVLAAEMMCAISLYGSLLVI